MQPSIAGTELRLVSRRIPQRYFETLVAKSSPTMGEDRFLASMTMALTPNSSARTRNTSGSKSPTAAL